MTDEPETKNSEQAKVDVVVGNGDDPFLGELMRRFKLTLQSQSGAGGVPREIGGLLNRLADPPEDADVTKNLLKSIYATNMALSAHIDWTAETVQSIMMTQAKILVAAEAAAREKQQEDDNDRNTD